MLSDDELPSLPEPVRMSSDQSYLGYTADQMREYGRACERAAYERAAKERELAMAKREPLSEELKCCAAMRKGGRHGNIND